MQPKKILFVRTDRFGEFILNLPTIKALYETYKPCKISVVCKPHISELLNGIGYIDEIIPYNPTKKNWALLRNLKLFAKIKHSRFDLAVIANPSKLFHIITFVAGIPKRVGYNRKWGCLLTNKVEDKKYLGDKREVEYNLDLAELAGAQVSDKEPRLIISDDDRNNTYAILKRSGISERDKLVAVHPSSSNPEKIWPLGKFSELGDKLISESGIKIILIGGEEERGTADQVKAIMKNPVTDLTGALSLRESASLLTRCLLLISNDSGPVHLAAAVGTPTVVLFGEERPGGSPKRWGPYGEGHLVISKPRVADIAAEEVYQAAAKKLKELTQR